MSFFKNLNMVYFVYFKVTNCTVNPGALDLHYFGADAGEFYSIGNLIQNGIDSAIRDKIRILPTLISEFIKEKVY